MKKSLTYKKLSFETNLTEHQISILKFIARWKFITSTMIQFTFSFSSQWTARLLLKLLYQKLIVRVRSSVSRGGVHEWIYYITHKAIKYLNSDYIVVSSPRRAYHLSEHAFSCLKIINSLGLKENDYLTESELSLRYREIKQQLSMESKPRMCDFGYVDPVTKDFVGVEVELHTKDKKAYIGEDFQPSKEKPEDIKFQNKDKLKFGTYVGGGEFEYVKTKNINLDLVRQDAKKQGFDPSKVFPIHKYSVIFTDVDGNKNQYDEVEGLSINQSKSVFFGSIYHQGATIQEVKVKKSRDCIIHRHYYALNKKFYNRIDWYLPEGKQHRFIKLMNNIFQNNIPKFYQIHTFEGGIGKKINHKLINYIKK